jgi:hypothetical protein
MPRPLPFTHQINNRGQNKKSKKEQGAVVVFDDNKVHYAEYTKDGAD